MGEGWCGVRKGGGLELEMKMELEIELALEMEVKWRFKYEWYKNLAALCCGSLAGFGQGGTKARRMSNAFTRDYYFFLEGD